MTAKKWCVWSLDMGNERWMVVDEGTQKAMEEGAARRMATAEKYRMDARYVALPRGEKP
jgi:hypothetical protein